MDRNDGRSPAQWITGLLLACAFLAGMGSPPARAHHSTSNFDFTRAVTITGVVSYVSLTNPHSFFNMKVDGPDGVTQYKVFATAKVALQRHGWRPDTLRAGDTVTVEGNPDKEDPNFLSLHKIKFADGTEWSTDEVYE